MRDMEALYRYREREGGPQFADEIVQRIVDATERLGLFPLSGRQGVVSGTRELVLKDLPYVIHYVVEEERVAIARVRHTSRQPLQ